ncbi:MAG: sigma-70 family RNA polymerase sigma factor [Phycisphaerales bacterium]
MTATRDNPIASGTSPPLSPAESANRDRALVASWCRAHGAGSETAADITQDVFVKLVAIAPEFECRAAQVAWLRRVTSNACVDAFRKSRPLSLVREPTAHISESVSDEERRALRDAVASLSEAQRLVLVAKAVEQVTFAELAADIGVAIPTVKTHYRRAIDALRLRLHALDSQESSS